MLDATNGVDVELRVDPVTAYKIAHLKTNPTTGQFELWGGYHNVKFGLVEEAICAKGGMNAWNETQHTAPDPTGKCFCGFNAYKDVLEASRSLYYDHLRLEATKVLLEVQLYGTVVEYADGYRAQKQSIMGVYIHDNETLDPLRLRQDLAVSAGRVSDLKGIIYDAQQACYIRPADAFKVACRVCEVCLDPVEHLYIDGGIDYYENRTTRCYRHALRKMYPEYEDTKGYIFNGFELIQGRHFLKAQSEIPLCDVCLDIAWSEKARRCRRHTIGALYGRTERGEDTQYEVRWSKNARPYIYRGFKAQFADMNTGLRAITVFMNKGNFQVQLVWQTRVERKDGKLVYPTKLEHWVIKDGWWFRKVRGKLVKVDRVKPWLSRTISDAIQKATQQLPYGPQRVHPEGHKKFCSCKSCMSRYQSTV